MLYAVGTKIDLSYLNERAVPQPEQASAGQHLYFPGTKILFLNLISSLDIISIKTQSA